MIRSTLLAGLSAGFLWASAHPAAAQEPKKADPAPKAEPAPMGGISPQTQKINALILQGYENGGIKKPAEKANDFEFLRRVFIDLQGRIPTPEEIYDFENDRGTNKRVRLVRRLLNEKYTPKGPGGRLVTDIPGLVTPKREKSVPIDYSGGYANNFAELYAVWLLSRSGVDNTYREQFITYLEEQFDKNISYRELVTSLISATGKSNENGAVHFVFRHLGDPIMAETKGARVEYEKEGKFDNVPITSRVTRMFLGIQTQCTQCHDHPQAKEWKQRDFWGVNAFFRQTDKRGLQTAMGKKGAVVGNAVELSDVPGWNRDMTVFYDQRDGQRKAMFATMLKDVAQAEADQRSTKALNSASGVANKSRRQVLAEWVTQHDNFEKAFVNRMWGHLFGRGLHKEPTVDDFKSDNEIVHPELMNYLAEQFKQYNYDVKKLLEWICTSDVYQLSHVAVKGLTDVKYDPYFARMPLKAQSPEVLFESLVVATRVRARLTKEAFYGDPTDPGKPGLKATWTSKLTSNFGDDEGNEANFNGTIVQALMMMNGRELNGQIKGGKDKGLLADVIAKRGTPAGVYDELFLMTVSRHPTAAELARLEEIRMGKARINLGGAPTTGKGPVVGTPVPGAAANDVTYYEDVLWALLNTNEFMLNH